MPEGIKHLTHKGVAVILRSVELTPQSRGARRFVATYSLDGREPDIASLKEVFEEPVFVSRATAEQHAFSMAKAAIEASPGRR